MPATPQSPDNLAQFRYLIGTNQEDAITAFAGGGQTSAYQLSAQQNNVTVVGSANDSVKLPKIGVQTPAEGNPGCVGMIVLVRNSDASDSMQVFGATPDTINGVATGTGVAVAAGKSALFWAHSFNQTTGVGAWFMLLSA